MAFARPAIYPISKILVQVSAIVDSMIINSQQKEE